MTTTFDKELLELAAKAAGIEYDAEASKPHPKSNAWFGLWLVIHGEPSEYQRRRWNPLTDDGDALRLAVKLDLVIDVYSPEKSVVVYFDQELHSACGPSPREEYGADPYAATRRAIVRAAAQVALASKEIGKNL